MRFFKVLVVILVAAALWLAGVELYLSTVDPTRFKARALDAVRDATGRELSVAGLIELDVFPVPSIIVEDVSLANASWGTSPDMIRVARIEADLLLIPLLFGRFSVGRFVLDKPEVLLETDADGRGNWEFDSIKGLGTPTTSDAEPVELDLVLMSLLARNGLLEYRDGESGQRHRAIIEELAVRENLVGDRLGVALAATYRDRPISLGGEIGRIRRLLRNQPFSLDLTLQALGVKLQGAGVLERPRQGDGLKLQVNLTAASAGEISEALDIELPPVEAIEASARLNRTRGIWRLDDLRSRFSLAGARTYVGGRVGDLIALRSVNLYVEMANMTGNEIALLMGVDPARLEVLESLTISGNLRDSGELYRLDNLKADAIVEAAEARASGRVTDLRGAGGLDLRLKLDGVQGHSIATMLGVEFQWLTSLRDLQGSARLSNPGGIYRLDELQARGRADGGVVRGKGTVPNLLNGKGIDLSLDLEGVPGRTLARLVELEHEAIESIRHLKTTTRLTEADGVYRLEDLRATAEWYEGHARVSGDIEGLRQEPNFRLAVELDGISARTLANLADRQHPGFDEVEDLHAEFRLSKVSDLYSVTDLAARARVAGSDARVQGSIADLLASRGLALRFDLQAESLASLTPIVGTKLSAVGPVQGSTTLRGDPRAFELSELRITAGENDLSGTLAIELRDEGTVASGSLVSTHLNFNELLAVAESTVSEPEEARQDERVFSAEPIPLPPIHRLDVDLRLHAERLSIGEVDIEKAELNIEQQAGRLRLESSHNAFGGRFSGVLTVDASVEPTAWTLELDGKQYLIEETSRQIRHTAAVEGGQADLELRLQGHGSSWREIMAGLDGRVYIVSETMTVRNTALARAADDVFTTAVRLATPKEDEQGQTIVECAVLGLEIDDGIASADRTIALETTKISMAAGGHIDLKDESLDMGAAFKARRVLKFSSGSLWKVVKVRGTLAEPELSADLTGAAKTAATVAGAVATAGLSLIAQEATVRFMEDSRPCRTASNRMAAARIEDVLPATASPPAGSRAREEYGSDTPEETIDDTGTSEGEKTGGFFKSIGRPFRGLFGK